MNKTVAIACVVSAALFAVGFMLPQPSTPQGGRVQTAAAPALADLFDPARDGGAQRDGASPF